ncbi:MAG: type IV pilus assembly protein PilM [Candidatus Eremiobacterota bacterium]
MNFLGKLFGGGKPPGMAGLDVGSDSIKVAQVRVTSSGAALLAYGSAPTPTDAFRAGAISDPEALGQAVAELLADTDLPPGTRIVSAVTGQHVVVRPITMARLPDRELGKAIQFEAEKYLPYQVSDAQVTGIKLRDLDQNKMETLLIAAPNEMINKAKGVIERAGCVPEAIDLEPLVLRRALKRCAPDKLRQRVMLLNLGAALTSINVLREGVLCHNRTITIAGHSITQAIQQSLNVSLDEAERLKKEKGVVLEEDIGGSPAARKIASAVQPVLTRMITELKRSFDYYGSTYRGESIDEIVLSGGTARFRGLAGFLSQGLQIGCSVADPFEPLSLPKGLDREDLRAEGPAAMTAIGLALR